MIIDDKNSLVEVYLKWFSNRGCEFEKIGKYPKDSSLGTYYITHKRSKKFFVMLSDGDIFHDNSIELDQIDRYKESVTFFYPIHEEHQVESREHYKELIVFFSGERDSKIDFKETQDISVINKYLKIV